MYEQSSTHQQGALFQEQDEDQNHVFQEHVVVTFSAIAVLIFIPPLSSKQEIISVCDTNRN